jgi:glutamine synthetase
MDIDEVARICEDRGIHTIECCFPDGNGFPRGKRIPTKHFIRSGHLGFDIANIALAWDRKCDVLPDMGYANFDTGYPDMRAVPDLSTFRPIPWREGAASVLCDCIEEDGSPAKVSTRAVLKSIVAEAGAMGFSPKVGAELEFYIFDADGSTLYQGIDCYSLTRGAMLEMLLGRVRQELDEFGIEIEACNTEYGPAQVEVNLRYADALEMTDRTMLFKAAVKEIAAQLGLRVSFMAKPFAEESGSGFHVHQSLTDIKTGEPLFASAEHTVDPSSVMGQYLAGLLRYFAEFTALGSPTINAYKRVKPYTFAATNVCWGIDNRTVGVRAIIGHGPANRLEWRNGAADANPYALIAASIAAGLEGVRQGMTLPPIVHGDAYSRSDLAPLPGTLDAALDALERSEFAHKIFGEFLDVFLVLGRHESALWAGVVTEWERDRYFDG